MYDYNEKVGNRLNEILEKNHEAEAGYKKAADNASSDSLTRFFNRKSQERKTFSHQIENELKHRFNQKPENGTSLKADAHRTWMDVKSFFSLDNDEAMLEAAITGEKNALKEYEEILNEKEPHIPAETQQVLRSQYQTINDDLMTIHRIEDIK